MKQDNYYNNPTSSYVASPYDASFNAICGYAAFGNLFGGIPYGLSIFLFGMI